MLLGAPAAMACRGGGRVRTPDGELLTPGKVAGHRLRDAVTVQSDAVRVQGAQPNVDVIVVGGGIAGLSAAWWLDRAGVKDVVVMELDRVAGGTAQSGASEVTAYPWGAHYVVTPMKHQTAMRALLGEVGAMAGEDEHGEPVVVEDLRVREPEERVFYRGRWYEGQYLHAGANAADRDQLARFRAEIDRWVAWRDAKGRRAFALPASAGSDDAEVTALDRVSFAQWLGERRFESSRLRWLCDYACRDDFGLLAADTSAYAGVSYFASRLVRPGAEHQPVVTWPDGNGALVAHLTGKLGARVRVDHAVADVNDDGDGVDVVVHTEGALRGLRARHVIVAVPGFVARRIVAPLRAGARPIPHIDRGAWAVANLHLDSRPRVRPGDAPLAWDNVLHDSPSLGYVVATHQRGREHGPTVLTWYYPFTGDGPAARKELDTATREDWAEVALADLAKAHPDLRGRCTRIDVAYWGHGMPRPRVGTVFDPALAAARAPLGRIHFAVSELSGVALFEEALDQGVRAADEVLASLAARGAP
ncbi:MAG TPA: FAD-dependent oxidoreductase [Kofleriaceae bacterium]|nr:FAD-dependent oxidoreductase [Kofleriaceae bacterium]